MSCCLYIVTLLLLLTATLSRVTVMNQLTENEFPHKRPTDSSASQIIVDQSQRSSEGQQEPVSDVSVGHKEYTLQKRSLEQEETKLQALIKIVNEVEQMQNINGDDPYNATITGILSILEELVLLPPSLNPISLEESFCVNNIVSAKEGAITFALNTLVAVGDLADSEIIYRCPTGAALLFKIAPQIVDDLLGYSIYASGDFNLGSNYDSKRFISYLVYPPNSSPLRPLPEAEFPVTRWQNVEVIFQDESMGLSWNSFQIVLRWFASQHTTSSKHKCAKWEADRMAWDTDQCVVFEHTGITQNISCFCNISFFLIDYKITREYILYEYEEDIASTIHLDQRQTSNATTEMSFSELHNYNLSSFVEYISQLSVVMRSNNAALVNALDDNVFKDIGKVLDKAQPEAGNSTIGVRSDDLASFVINLQSYERDPPLGFGVYTNRISGIAYFRKSEEIDYRVLSSTAMSFALLFSPSVANQNSRFAFLLYPPDKFFKPTAIIDGHQVSSMRVLDVVLTPSNFQGQDQLVHMFSSKLIDSSGSYGCASWNESLVNWTTSNCQPNPDFYDGVCTCKMSANFVGSPTRGQYILFTQASTRFTPKSPVGPDPESQAELIIRSELSIRYIHSLMHSGNPDTESIAVKVLRFLDEATKSSGLRASSINQVITDSRSAVSNGIEQLTNSNGFLTNNNFVSTVTDRHFIPISLSCGFDERECSTFSFIDEQSMRKMFNTNNSYAFHVVPSKIIFAMLYAFILYPPGVSLHSVSRLSKNRVDYFRVIDLTMPTNVDTNFVLLYLAHPKGFAIGCAFWSDDLAKWTDTDCSIATINSVEVCNCSLVINNSDIPWGRQYIAYTYPNITFDNDFYGMIGAESFTDANVILTVGADLIRNASQCLFGDDADLATRVMRVYHKILINGEDLPQRPKIVNQILDDLEIAFDRFFVDPSVPVSFIYDIPTFWSIKNAEVATDLFSNAVLSSGAVGGESTKMSDFALAVIGHLHLNADMKLHGIQFARTNNARGEYFYANNTGTVIEDNPQLACFVTNSLLLSDGRVIFAVYPLNLSPYPYTMTKHPVFNSRQIDIYVDSNEISPSPGAKDRSNSRAMVQVYFQPTDFPKNYVMIACAAWNTSARNWTEDVCTANVIAQNRIVSCSCNLTAKRSVTRIMAYEFTEIVNFSLLQLFDGPSVVFIVSASFSLAGFTMIAVTALLFSTWRDELGNKVLMHLTSSSFLYLCFTIFRETHVIFADMKRLDISLVAFTACVHYTRMVHHCWGLVMSVLQYKKFSTVVGASATSHLLLKVAVSAWGAPLLPLVVLLSWNQRDHFCSPDKLTHYMLYLVPVVVITLLNIGFLVAIIRNMTNGCGLWNDDELQKHGGSSKDVLMRQLKQTVMMFFLFGIPTVFEMFNDIGSHNVALDYIAKILNPIQGFVMFLFFVIMNDKVRGLWNVHVFGDALPTKNPPQTKKVSYKPKVSKKTNYRVNLPKKNELTDAVRQCAVGETEIQISTSDVTSRPVGDSVKYVVERGDVIVEDRKSCAGLEDINPGLGDEKPGLKVVNLGSSKESTGNEITAYRELATSKLESVKRHVEELSDMVKDNECVLSLKSLELCAKDIQYFVSARLAGVRKGDVEVGEVKESQGAGVS